MCFAALGGFLIAFLSTVVVEQVYEAAAQLHFCV